MNKRLVLTMVMCFCFIFVWNYIGVKFGFIREVPIDEPGQVEITEQINPEASPAPVTANDETATDDAQADPPAPEIEQRTVVLQNNQLRLIFDNRGAVVLSAVLKEYYNSAEKLETVRLITPTRYFPGDVRLPDAGSTRNLMYAVEENGNSVTFTHRGADRTIRKTFTLADDFKLAAKVELEGGDGKFDMVVAEGLQPVLPGDKLVPSIWDMGAISPKILKTSWSQDGSHEESPPDDDMNFTGFDPLLKKDDFIDWVGVQDTYFANVFLLEKPVRNAWMGGVQYSRPGKSDPAYIPAVAVPGEGGQLVGHFYLGPLEENALLAADPHLENLIDYGWAGLLSKALFVALKFAHDLTGNWGWSIVLMTLFIRVLMIPMMVPSLKSGYKMRQLQPKMEKLKQKYSGEDLESKQKLSQETFALYKAEGVNPFSSCFSLFLQMPIFFAYFGLLRASITLRQAEWHFWITDLSVKDPYYVLPILMAVTMFISTMLTPMPSTDPMQQKMMKIMPLMFAFMFIGMPAGLVLYMITNNIFTMGQNLIMKRRYDT